MSTSYTPQPAMIFGQRMHRLDQDTWLITRIELEQYQNGWVIDDQETINAIMSAARQWGIDCQAWVSDDVLYVRSKPS